MKKLRLSPISIPTALGLGLLIISDIYTLAYLYLWHGDAADITISNISRNCAYLFFLAAVISLFPDTLKGKKALRIVLQGISAVAIALIFYGEITMRPDILYYSALIMMILCFLPSAYLICIGKRKVKAFAATIIFMCLLDTVNRLAILFDFGGHWRTIIPALFPIAYILIGYTINTVGAAFCRPRDDEDIVPYP